MADGREQREEQKRLREQEEQEDREGRLDRDRLIQERQDEWAPERGGS